MTEHQDTKFLFRNNPTNGWIIPVKTILDPSFKINKHSIRSFLDYMHTFNNNESRKQSRLAKVKAIVCNENYLWAHRDLDKNYVIIRYDYQLIVKPDGTIKSFVQGIVCWNEMENINDVWVDKIDKLIDDQL